MGHKLRGKVSEYSLFDRGPIFFDRRFKTGYLGSLTGENIDIRCSKKKPGPRQTSHDFALWNTAKLRKPKTVMSWDTGGGGTWYTGLKKTSSYLFQGVWIQECTGVGSEWGRESGVDLGSAPFCPFFGKSHQYEKLSSSSTTSMITSRNQLITHGSWKPNKAGWLTV